MATWILHTPCNGGKKPNQLFLSLLVLLLKKTGEFLAFPILQSYSALEFFCMSIKIILG